MGSDAIMYAGIALGGAAILGGLVYFVKSPSSNYLKPYRPSNLYNAYKVDRSNREGQRTVNQMFSGIRDEAENAPADYGETLYRGGKTRKQKKSKRRVSTTRTKR